MRNRLAQVLVVAIGLLLGIAGTLVWASARDDGGHRVQPSVKRFSFPAASAKTSAVASDPNPVAGTPQSARAALSAFFDAEQADDPVRAFGLLDAAGRDAYTSPAGWQASRAQRLVPVSYRLGGERSASADAVDIEVFVSHEPGLDPFNGLTPGRTRQVWRVVREGGTWRVHSEPVEVEPLYPDPSRVTAVLSEWLARRQACDAAGARRFELTTGLIGSPWWRERPCAERGDWKVEGGVEPVDATGAGEVVSAFGPGVGDWGKQVRVRGPRSRLTVIFAPIGDDWRVIGVLGTQY